MKSTPTILFFIFLADLVNVSHQVYSYYNPYTFDCFLQRLEYIIAVSSLNILPFTVRDRVIENLRLTSNDFKDVCNSYEFQSLSCEGDFSPSSSLNKTIYCFFCLYKQSANEKSDKLDEIQSMDPIGFNAYLTRQNVDQNSPTFKESIEEFLEMTYSKIPLKDSNHHLADFMQFLQRLEESIIESSSAALPFTKKEGVIESLKKTSDEFKDLCIRFENKCKQENGHFSPISSLNATIYHFFFYYKKSTEEEKNILEEIESVNPIGFNAFLESRHEDEKSPTFLQTAKKFRKVMYATMPLTDTDEYNHSDFDEYVQRLEGSIESSSLDALPFMAKHSVIDKLKKTSGAFKELCIGYDNESQRSKGQFSPVMSLQRSINMVFYNYISSLKDEEHRKMLRKMLRKIKSVDPIGFNGFLTEKNVSETSSDFINCIEKFKTTMYKKALITDSSYSLEDFMEFIERLEDSIEAESLAILPFTLKVRVRKCLKKTSDKFKDLCIRNDLESKRQNGEYSPVSSLNETIRSVFFHYKRNAKGSKRLLKEIQAVDPIGLHVYITKNSVSTSSPTFLQSIADFQTTLYGRVRLYNSRTDDSYIAVYDHKRGLHQIPDVVRETVTDEYGPFCRYTIDFFADLAMEQFPHIEFYYLHANFSEYKRHKSRKINDVQILYGHNGPNESGHTICINYQASSRNVLVYDSSMFENLDQGQEQIVDRLYPFRKDIVYMRPKSRPDGTPTCAVFSMIYATMLLLEEDPAQTEFRLNHVYGDDTLYMRLHIMNMFANRKLTLME